MEECIRLASVVVLKRNNVDYSSLYDVNVTSYDGVVELVMAVSCRENSVE